MRAVTPGYFAILAIPVRHGRPFSATDRGTTEPVAVVGATAAEQLWPGSSPLGRRVLARGQGNGIDTAVVARTVVGVVADVRQSPTDTELADLYVPLAQMPGRFTAVLTRPTQPIPAWTTELRRAVATVDRDIAVNAPQVLSETVERQLARPRFLAALFAAFGLFATMLGTIGLYAVIAYAVRQREHEIAIRMAVGAGATAIVRLFMREGITILVAGTVAGVVAAIALGRLLRSQLFGVETADPATLALASLALGIASVAAMLLPARRATRIDPIIAPKEE